MRWKCLLALSLLCASLAPSLAQGLPPESATPSGPDSGLGTPPLSQQLRSLATTLELATSDSATDWELLLQEWTTLSSKLEELATLSAGSEQEMQSMRESLRAFEGSLTASMKAKESAESREVVWRGLAIGGTVVGIAGISALVFILATR